MRVPILVLSILLMFCFSQAESDVAMIRVSGVVTDFSGKPLEGATVYFEDENFKPLFTAYTDINGEYSIELEDRKYIVFAVKDYAEKYLEYWHWNFTPTSGRRLEIKLTELSYME